MGAFVRCEKGLFALVQIPFGDIRRFVERPSGPARPVWSAPSIGCDFVPGLGPLNFRPLGGHRLFTNEQTYCDLSHTLKFSGDSKLGASSDYRCYGRRLFFDGVAVGRIEVGFGAKNAIDNPRLFSNELLLRNVTFRDIQAPLFRVGETVTQMFEDATTRRPKTDPQRLCTRLRPLVLLTQYVDDPLTVPQGYRLMRSSKLTKESRRHLALYHLRTMVSGIECDFFCI